jgi:hypothetical protein
MRVALFVTAGILLAFSALAANASASSVRSSFKAVRFEVVVTYKAGTFLAKRGTHIAGSYGTRTEAEGAASKLRQRGDVDNVMVRIWYVTPVSKPALQKFRVKPVEVNSWWSGAVADEPGSAPSLPKPVYCAPRTVYFGVLVKWHPHETASDEWNILHSHVRGEFVTRGEAEAQAEYLMVNGLAKAVKVVEYPHGKMIYPGPSNLKSSKPPVFKIK